LTIGRFSAGGVGHGTVHRKAFAPVNGLALVGIDGHQPFYPQARGEPVKVAPHGKVYFEIPFLLTISAISQPYVSLGFKLN